MFQYFKKRRQLSFTCLLLPILVVSLLFLFPQAAEASIGDLVLKVLGALLWPVIFVLSKLLLLVIRLITVVAVYNDFTNSPVVEHGWKIVRDIANMFFLVMLLVIAFGTVLKIEQYSYKRRLATLLIMAVLINFSRMICGLFIDLGQVVMLTFMSAIKGVAETNFANMLGLGEVLTLTSSTAGIDALGAISTVLYALILVIISLIVCLIFLVILVFRIVILWILVVLSPIAFIGQVLPGMQKYAGQWWQKFTSQVIIGPVLAFFLWLTLAVGQVTGTGPEGEQKIDITEHFKAGLPQEQQDQLKTGVEKRVSLVAGGGGTELTASLSKMGTADRLMGFAITIAMLLGGLMAAQQLGVAGSQMAGKALGKIQAYASGAAKFPWKGIAKPAVSSLAERLSARTGIPLLPSMWKEGWKEARRRRRDRRITAMKAKELIFGAPEDFLHDWFTWKTGFGLKAIHGVRMLKKLEKKHEQGKITSKELESQLTPDQLKLYEHGEKMRKEAEERKKLEEKTEKGGDLYVAKSDFSNKVLEGTAEGLKHQIEITIDEKTKDKLKEQLNRIEKALKDEKAVAVPIKAEWQEAYTIWKEKLREGGERSGQEFKEVSEKISKDEALTALDQHAEKMKKYEEGLKNLRVLKPFGARVGIANLVAEEERKLSQVKEPQELTKYLDDAFKMKDKIRAMAIMRKLTRDYNDNEALNYYGYTSNMEGMHQYINEKFIKGLGMDEQEALQFETDIGYINEDVKHMETARLTMVDEVSGKIKQATEDEHLAVASYEISKMNPRNALRDFNRLAYGGETEIILPDGTKKRIFKISKLGSKILKDFSGAIEDQLYETNINAAQKIIETEDMDGSVTEALLGRGMAPKNIEYLLELLRLRASGKPARGDEVDKIKEKYGRKKSREKGPKEKEKGAEEDERARE